MNSRIEILLVEDNPSDVLLVRHALDAHRVPCHLHVARDGAEALSMLPRPGHEAPIPMPDLLLLDLNLPKIDGPEVLSEIRRMPNGAAIPAIIISSSDESRDRARVDGLGIAHYFKKPASYDRFLELGVAVRQAIADKLT